jgi:glucose/arabinose dehydrogenase
VVPGAPATSPDLTWLTLPPGFCAHYYGTVGDARQLRFDPGGDLFVASPTTGTTGGNPVGAIAGIAVLPDDDHDGVADSNITFLDHLPSVQGLMFADGFLYYQDGSTIRRVPFRPGDRRPSGGSEIVTTFDPNRVPQDGLHWPKVFDRAQDGTIYVSNGSTQLELCTSTRPVFGAIFQLNADGTTGEVAKGFRNPIAMRCEVDHNVCLVAELALDYSASTAGREKLVPLHPGDDWGYPCCATRDTPYGGVTYNDTGTVPDCSGVGQESGSFIIGHTPFGLDFEMGRWPAPWAHRVFLTLHGDVGTWDGARVVAIALDATSGLPLRATELEGGAADPDSMLEFATGWADGTHAHGRPAPITFAPDGRMFLGDDQRGMIVWIAPVDTRQP